MVHNHHSLRIKMLGGICEMCAITITMKNNSDKRHPNFQKTQRRYPRRMEKSRSLSLRFVVICKMALAIHLYAEWMLEQI